MRGLLFGRFLKNFPWSPLCTFSENAGFGWPRENCNNLAITELLKRFFAPKSFPVCTLRVLQLEDNAICATVLLGLSNRGYFFGDFWKTFLFPHLALFQKMRVLGDLAKRTITWPLRNVLSRWLRQNLLQFFHFKCILIRGLCHFCQCFGPFKRGLLFGRILENFSSSPLCTFSENAGFGWPCKKCNNLAIRALLEPLFCPKILSSRST